MHWLAIKDPISSCGLVMLLDYWWLRKSTLQSGVGASGPGPTEISTSENAVKVPKQWIWKVLRGYTYVLVSLPGVSLHSPAQQVRSPLSPHTPGPFLLAPKAGLHFLVRFLTACDFSLCQRPQCLWVLGQGSSWQGDPVFHIRSTQEAVKVVGAVAAAEVVELRLVPLMLSLLTLSLLTQLQQVTSLFPLLLVQGEGPLQNSLQLQRSEWGVGRMEAPRWPAGRWHSRSPWPNWGAGQRASWDRQPASLQEL